MGTATIGFSISLINDAYPPMEALAFLAAVKGTLAEAETLIRTARAHGGDGTLTDSEEDAGATDVRATVPIGHLAALLDDLDRQGVLPGCRVDAALEDDDEEAIVVALEAGYPDLSFDY